MTDVAGTAPKGAFFDTDEAAQATERAIAVVEELHRRFGESALSASAQEVLTHLTSQLATTALKIHDDLSELEEKEPFGGEDSYWNTFRLFCAGDNRGIVRSGEDIWSHLSLSFDMGGETVDTLFETLDEWKNDIAEDAKKKFGVVGEFQEVERGFVFVESLQSPKPQSGNKSPVRAKAAKRSQKDSEADIETEIDIVEVVRSLIPADGHSVKQSEVAKAIILRRPGLDHAEVIGEINRLIEGSPVYKYKPRKNQPSYLTLNAEVVRAIADPDSSCITEEAPSTESLTEADIRISADIVGYIINSTKHVQEKLSTIKIANGIRGLHDSAKPLETREINRYVRILAEHKILQFDIGAPLRGRRKGLSRAKSRQVMRAGIATQQVRDELKVAMGNNEVAEYIEEILTR